MTKPRLLRLAAVLLLAAAGIVTFRHLDAQGPKDDKNAPQWVWAETTTDEQTVWLRKEFALDQPITSASLQAACDNVMTVYLDGKQLFTHDNWETPVGRDVTKQLRRNGGPTGISKHVLAVKAQNTGGPAGLVLRLVVEGADKQTRVIVTDSTWRVSEADKKGWETAAFNDSAWKPATVIAKLGGGAWGEKVTAATFTGAAGPAKVGKFAKPTATPIQLIKAKKDFKVELLYSVPRDTQGSWVSLCADPKGRLIASDQGGKLYRITPPAIGGKAEDTEVEALPVELGEAHGLCWAFDSLYVVVNEGRKYKPRGLWRVTSSQNNDVLDKKELLREIDGSGEHGPHAVIPGPDGKSLYVLHGNHTKPIKTDHTTVPRIWGEDFLVPRLWDASGHAVGIIAPAGSIYKTDKDGKDWTLISIGYRNEYDAAFNRDGELFTYDSDMEWDMNLPWYRPTRVCHAVPGSEFGWRGGTGKMYEYHPDNLPPVVNVGPGSPTGVSFGYGTKFPAKYQEALFLCDWSYGKIYACHLKEDGASYTGELEEFLNGSPLPLTDIAIGPKDGALYFTIGGRSTMSGLYRVTYVGNESTEPLPHKSSDSPLRTARKKLESYYGKKDPQAVEVAWPYLSSPDRFLRYAARTVLEFQDPKLWQDKALKEADPIARTHALIGLARLGDKALLNPVIDALNGIAIDKLTPPQQIDTLRAYQLAIIRLGPLDSTARQQLGKRFTTRFPTANREVNVEMAKLMCYGEYPSTVERILAQMAKAPTQEEQIEFALALRTVKDGWTKKQREEYLNWFHKGMTYRGGNSFHAFLRNIRTDFIKTLTPGEREDLKDVLAVTPEPKAPKFDTKPRPLVKNYTVAELVPMVEKGLTGRDFDRGRNLFGEAKCFYCHRFNNEGGGTGPDLTQLAGRFNTRDLLESIIEPSKVISDQYQSVVVTTTDGQQVMGRIVNLAGENIMINTDMLDSNKIRAINRNQIDTIGVSRVSMMPTGLLDTFTQDEVLDLMAYLYSRGNRNDKMFKRP